MGFWSHYIKSQICKIY